MKLLFSIALILSSTLCSNLSQEFEANLPYEEMYTPAMSSFDSYIEYIKELFFSTGKNRHYPLFKQCDDRWRNDMIKTKTVCQVGCLMSSVSMALNGLGEKIEGAESNPGTLNAWLKTHGGYQDNLFVWGSITKAHSLKYLGKFKSATDYVSDKYIVILNVHNGGHWVLATSYSGGVYQVNDPGYKTTSYSTAEVTQAAVYEIL